MGDTCGVQVNEYLTMKGEEVHTVGVIQTNPEQSKHLETARVRIRGVWIDLVNLRSEEYAEESRIPTMEFGATLPPSLPPPNSTRTCPHAPRLLTSPHVSSRPVSLPPAFSNRISHCRQRLCH